MRDERLTTLHFLVLSVAFFLSAYAVSGSSYVAAASDPHSNKSGYDGTTWLHANPPTPGCSARKI
jgi:hypothetical protein